MAVTPTPALPQFPKNAKVQILPADGLGLKTIYTGGANGSKITAVIVTSSDTAARDVTIGITRTAVFYPLGTFTVGTTAGQAAATVAVNGLSSAVVVGLPIDNDGQTYIFLTDASDTLQVKALTTVTALKELDFTAFGADF